MRFKTRFALKDRQGESKIVRKFLWIPTAFASEKESRWLEVADVVYTIKRVARGDWDTNNIWKWRKDRFATDKDYAELPFESSVDLEDVFEKYSRNLFLWASLDILSISMIYSGMASGSILLFLGNVMFFVFKFIQIIIYFIYFWK